MVEQSNEYGDWGDEADWSEQQENDLIDLPQLAKKKSNLVNTNEGGLSSRF